MPNTATKCQTKTIHSLVVYIGENFEPMAQKVTTDKVRKEKELIRKKEHSPLIQVDKQGDPISNFISNFKRQFREAKGLIDWNRLFGGKRAEPPKQPVQPESIIGATKTVMRSDFKNDKKTQTVQTKKKPDLRMDNTIKTQQARPKNNKPKLGL
jgi:hypothetical protein